MLKILSANPTGLGPFGYHADVVINDCGVVWLNGENRDKGCNNGAGKSWFFNVIAFCLWGRVETVIGGSMTGSDELSNEILGLGACPRVLFEDGAGVLWRVTVSRKWKAPKANPSPYVQDSPLWPYKGSDIFLERLDHATASWVDERKSESPQTRKKILAIIGISYERYLVTTYLAQGKGLDFLRGTHGQRMAIFTDVMDLGVWDAATAECKVKRDAATKVALDRQVYLARLQGEHSAISVLTDEQVAAITESNANAAKAIADAELKREELSTRLAQIAEQIGTIRVGVNPYAVQVQEHHNKARYELHAIEQQLAEKYAQGRAIEQRNQNMRASIYQKRSPAVDQLNAKIAAAKASLARVQKSLADFLSGKLTHCPTCGQDLPNKVDGSHLQQDVDNVKAELNMLEAEQTLEVLSFSSVQTCEYTAENDRYVAECAVHKSALEALVLQEQVAKTRHASELAVLEEQRAAYDTSEASKTAAIGELTVKQGEVSRHRTSIELWLQQTHSTVQSNSAALKSDAENKLRRCVTEERIKVAEKEMQHARLDETEWTWLLKNLGDKGMKAYKLEVICQRLNELLVDALSDIDGSFRLWVKPYRVRDSAKGKAENDLTSEDVVNDITVYVQEGGKQAVPLYLYSGGEASVVAIALLVAMWQLADERGTGTNLLLLDEVVGFLDQRNSQVVSRFLEGLKTAGKTVIAVSHSQVVDSVNFDAVWRCVKVNGISTLYCK